MATLRQGENFDEAPVVDVNGNDVNPDNLPQQPSPNAPKLGPKQIAIAAVVLVVGIIIVLVLFGGSGNSTESTDSTAPTTTAEPLLQDTPVESNSGDLFDFDEPASTTPTTSAPTISSDPVTNPYVYCFYSEEEVTSLRGYGYTGDEIEYNSQLETPYDYLVEQAINEMNEKYSEWRSMVIDSASPEYTELLEKSYLSGKETKDNCTTEDVGGYGKMRENVDYTKCGVYNYQAWVKVETKYGVLFMTMDLPRYSELKDTGNMVVEYRYAVDTNNTFLYVYEIYEVEI